MIYKLLLTLALIPLLSSHAAEIELSVDRTSLSMEDQITLTVSVTGARDLDSAPYIAGLEEFQVEKGGTSSQVQIINGEMSVEKIFSYVLYPVREGKFKIGPASIDYNGQSLNSKPLSVEIKKSVAINKSAIKDRYYFVEATVDKSHPYVGEQISYSLKFYSRATIANAHLDPTKFESFLQEDVGKQNDYSQNIDGVRWDVTEIKAALFANAPGNYKLDPATLTIDVIVNNHNQRARQSVFGSFFGGMGTETKRVRLKTQPIEINVQALPTENRPETFSQLVGDFKITADVSKKETTVGASTTLTVKISGIGNIRNANLPNFNFDNFKSYPDRPQLEISNQNGVIGGVKTFVVALVPQNEGSFTIPPIAISFFNPSSKDFKTIKTSPFAINVRPGTGEQTNHISSTDLLPAQKTVTLLGKDLMPIKRDIAQFRSGVLSFADKLFVGLAVLVLPILFTFLFWLKRRRDQFAGNIGLQRKSIAYKNFTNGIKKISNSSKFHQDASTLLRTYIGDKLNIDGKALTAMDIDRKLKNAGLSPDLVEEIKDFIRNCEMGIYGGGISSMDSKNTTETLKKCVKNLEKEIH